MDNVTSSRSPVGLAQLSPVLSIYMLPVQCLIFFCELGISELYCDIGIASPDYIQLINLVIVMILVKHPAQLSTQVTRASLIILVISIMAHESIAMVHETAQLRWLSQKSRCMH